MIKTGLVSISFRALPPEEIIRIAKTAGLAGIEWGGDVHVPVGDLQNARQIARMTTEAGLTVSAYGSYYRVGTVEKYPTAFQAVLDTAIALGAKIIRIWAGDTASRETDEAQRNRILHECRDIARMAHEQGITPAFECHRHTLTDDYHSAGWLCRETEIKMFWQPNEDRDFAYNQEALQSLLPLVTNVHVFHWPAPGVRQPLAEGVADWKNYLALLNTSQKTHWCSLEFMPDDNPESLPQEAETLRKILQSL